MTHEPYDETVKALQTMLEVPLNQTDENFMRILPRIFEYAEGGYIVS